MRAIAFENHHAEALPELPEGGYHGYFENMHGEQLLFHQGKGEPEAFVWHGDTDWQRYPVRGGLCPGLVLSAGERLWIAACWAESAGIRHSGASSDEVWDAAREVAGAMLHVGDMNPRLSKAIAEVFDEGVREAKRQLREQRSGG